MEKERVNSLYINVNVKTTKGQIEETVTSVVDLFSLLKRLEEGGLNLGLSKVFPPGKFFPGEVYMVEDGAARLHLYAEGREPDADASMAAKLRLRVADGIIDCDVLGRPFQEGERVGVTIDRRDEPVFLQPPLLRTDKQVSDE